MLLQKPLLRVLVTAVLSITTTVMVAAMMGYQMYRSASFPRPVTGPMKTGWPFTIVAMDGNRTVDLVHEWSGSLTGHLGVAASNAKSDPATKAAAREDMESHNKKNYVWADTGRASRPLRYYLTPADLQQANSQLDNSDPMQYRNVEVEVLDDDPIGKHQTVKVTDYDEDDDVINVYRVENERVRPVGWSRCRPGRAIVPILIIICPLIFVVSSMFWKRLLRVKLLSPPSGSTHQ